MNARKRLIIEAVKNETPIPEPINQSERDLVDLAEAINESKELPKVTSADSGKVATVGNDGKWELGEGGVEETLVFSGTVGQVPIPIELPLYAVAALDVKVNGDKATGMAYAGGTAEEGFNYAYFTETAEVMVVVIFSDESAEVLLVNPDGDSEAEVRIKAEGSTIDIPILWQSDEYIYANVDPYTFVWLDFQTSMCDGLLRHYNLRAHIYDSTNNIAYIAPIYGGFASGSVVVFGTVIDSTLGVNWTVNQAAGQITGSIGEPK